MERAKTARNVAIIALIAAAVAFIPGGERAKRIVEALLAVALCVAVAYLALRYYREWRTALHTLGDGHRAALYGAIATALTLALAKRRMWETGLGELLWFVAAGAVVYALLAVYRRWRSY